MQKGILIVFEGIDGSGKSTQAEILLERLQEEDFDAVYFREPSKGKWGRKIKKKALHPDSLSPEEELDLFQKDRRENVEKNLKPALKKKRIVILDRYYYSTIAYQGAKGIDEKLIRRINEEFIVEPDLDFVSISDKIGPAVVRIAAEKVEKRRVSRFREDVPEDFWDRFFGIPREREREPEKERQAFRA
ncbi:unnamed protein product [marine sediment metagenome]|uniref:dTMP kinase n=1 Tax=marine sediment metagenome TaxID=412755 RepID=X1NLM3_9ZZZZ